MQADVVLTTLMGVNYSYVKSLGTDHFSVTVIEECSQGIEPACYPGILRSRKLILAGDHKQLPAVILDREAEKDLQRSLMERMIGICVSYV